MFKLKLSKVLVTDNFLIKNARTLSISDCNRLRLDEDNKGKGWVVIDENNNLIGAFYGPHYTLLCQRQNIGTMIYKIPENYYKTNNL